MSFPVVSDTNETMCDMNPIPEGLNSLLAAGVAPQKRFPYPTKSWQEWTSHLGNLGGLLESLPSELNRTDTAKLVEDLIPKNIAGAFTIAMIWGHGNTPYGPFRTARILTGSEDPKSASLSDEVIEKLSKSVELARENGILESYRYLNYGPGKIKNLGSAFFTKWLYFVTARGDAASPLAAPVMDLLVVAWLKDTAGVTLRERYAADYEEYLELLTDWGKSTGATPAQVEEAIFRLIRNDEQ